MRTKFAAAIAAAVLPLAMGAGVAVAVTAPAYASEKFSVESTPIETLVADAKAKAVVDKYLPGLEAHPAYGQVKGMSLRALSAYPQAGLDDAKLKAIQAELDAL